LSNLCVNREQIVNNSIGGRGLRDYPQFIPPRPQLSPLVCPRSTRWRQSAFAGCAENGGALL